MPSSFPRLLVICSILPCISTFWLPCARAIFWLPCRDDPTAAPTPVPTPTPSFSVSPTVSESPTASPTESESNIDDANDLFTIIFVSDIENQWRGHDIYRSRHVVKHIRDLSQQELFFDGDYSNVTINPQLVVNGGDITHWWNCEATSSRLMNFFSFSDTCRTPAQEFSDIWGQLYEAGIPMISAYGNHDWRPKLGTGNYWAGTPQQQRDEQTDQINAWSSEFTRETYERSLNLGEGLGIEDYEEILPTGAYGQSMFRATFRGLQLASLNAAYNFQSYDIDGTIYSSDEQLQQLAGTLNRSKATMFFSHFPLSATRLQHPSPTLGQVKSLIREFPSGTHHFAGHYHAALVQSYTESLPHFNDYICPYPHTWDGREPGYLAVLASSRDGILQVKTMTIPGLEDGTVCIPANDQSASGSSQFLRQRFSTNSPESVESSSTDNACERCKRGAQYFSNTRGEWVCGQDEAENFAFFEGEEEEDLGMYGDSLDS